MKSKHKMNLFKEETRDVFFVYEIKFTPPLSIKYQFDYKGVHLFIEQKTFLLLTQDLFPLCRLT